MSTYEIKYRCYMPYALPGYEVPFIRYKYRKSDSHFWSKKVNAPVDKYAVEHWGNEYYEDIDQPKSPYERMYTLNKIVFEKYGGVFENYVKAMVESDIMNDLIDKRKDFEAFAISSSFITDGWKCISTITAGIEKEGDSNNEKLD